MAKTATPATLFELAQADAQRQYRLRMEQLERARATLAELEKDAEAISAAGITLDWGSSELWDFATQSLNVSAGYCAELQNEELLRLLGERGWVVIHRINVDDELSKAFLKRSLRRLTISELPGVPTPVVKEVDQRPPVRLLRLKDVMQATGLSRSTIYRMVDAGKFPKPICVSERCIAWPDSQVNAWINSKATEATPE